MFRYIHCVYKCCSAEMEREAERGKPISIFFFSGSPIFKNENTAFPYNKNIQFFQTENNVKWCRRQFSENYVFDKLNFSPKKIDSEASGCFMSAFLSGLASTYLFLYCTLSVYRALRTYQCRYS